MAMYDYQAFPYIFGSWQSVQPTLIGGEYKFSFDSDAGTDAPAALLMQVRYWNGSEFVIQTFNGPGEFTITVGDGISQPQFSVESLGFGQLVHVTVDGPDSPIPPPKAFQWPTLPSFHDPLVLDLQGTGLNLTSVTNSPVYFDFSGSGTATQTGWITPGEGLLLLNNGSGNLSQEILGAQSGDGFADLEALDSNGDGVINAEDPAFSSLEVWVDQTTSGQGEIETLSQLGITSISLSVTPVGGNINGNIVVSGSTFSGSNGTSTISEVDFQTSAVHERYVPPAGFSYSPEALLLPQLDGYGNLPDLQVSMTQESSLLDSVQSLVLDASSMSGADFDAAFQDVMLEWAGVSGVAAGTYGPNVDAQHLAFIGALYGIDFATQGDPNGIAGPK